jgi:HlyD family secretion protein
MQKMKRYLLAVVLASLAVVAIGSVWPRGRDAQGEPPIQTARVSKQDFSVIVRTVGELDAARSTVVSSQVRGDKGKIIYLIEDGSRVQENDVLARLDPTPFEEEVQRLKSSSEEREALVEGLEQGLEWQKSQSERESETAKYNLDVARLNLDKLDKGEGPLEMARLEGAAGEAQKEYDEAALYSKDLEGLAERGRISPAEVEQAKKKAGEAAKRYELAKLQHESYRDHVLPTQLAQARAAVARSEMDVEEVEKSGGFSVGKAMAELKKTEQELATLQSTLKEAQDELERAVVRSPIPGTVVLCEAHRDGQRRKPRIGDIVWQNQPLIYVPDVSKMIVKTQVREIDLHSVIVGRPALVYVDAYPDLKLAGKVDSIGVLAETREESRTSDKYFQVTISVEGTDDRLRPGMTSRVEIQCAEVHGVAAAPVQAVFREQGRCFCYLRSGQSFEIREVVVGAQSEDWAELLDGLAVGDEVALSQPLPVQVHDLSVPAS